jgi:hypothetical protein
MPDGTAEASAYSAIFVYFALTARVLSSVSCTSRAGTGVDIEALSLEQGRRTPTILRKGGTIATIPLAPRTARAIDLASGERAEGPQRRGRR